MALHAGIDTGGTFTDLVVLDDETGRAVVAKVPSTPADPAAAFFRSLEAAGVEAAALASVTLGTTVGTNALLERKGARVVLLTTAGFEDIPAIGRRWWLFEIGTRSVAKRPGSTCCRMFPAESSHQRLLPSYPAVLRGSPNPQDDGEMR